jgi:hypothetical protein
MMGYGPASDMVDFGAGHWWEIGMNLLLPKLATVFMSPPRPLWLGPDSLHNCQKHRMIAG